ncbi:hypothetical protein GCM10025868_14310 [Angustibacter aerolatus]|uniref:Major facilitator superfamily (MFS) profile domain-containing protein n=1 Tax=Angustibacter aerolatus TaxID=1162965 RepID=A0ABQ6JHE5_9ACTN|nr:hypothetical protein GCM10025868_14310 [Angustibacter aerolatus]
MVVAVSDPARVGRSFGVHRSLDTVGALIGPLAAFAVLWALPGRYDAVFVLSTVFAVLGVAVMALLVPDVHRRRAGTAAEPAESYGPAGPAGPAEVTDPVEGADGDGRSGIGGGDAVRLPDHAPDVGPRAHDRTLRARSGPAAGEVGEARETRETREVVPGGAERPRSRPSLRLLADRRLSALLGVAGLLGLLTVGDGFLYLTLLHRDGFAASTFPLLFVGTDLGYLATALPLGRLADRVGRAGVLLGGHLALVLAYLAAAGPVSGVPATVACLLLLGTYYGATDGVLPALAGRVVDPTVRASGIAAAQTVVALARAASSVVFGLLWVAHGPGPSLVGVAALLVVALALVARPLRRLDRS